MSIDRVATSVRRDEILAAVIAQISATGSGDVAMVDVVRRSGAALKTIYRAFGSKERMLAEALLVWHRSVVEQATTATPAPDVRGRVAQYLEFTLEAFAGNRGMARLLVRNFSTEDSGVAAALTRMQHNLDEMLVRFLNADAPTLTLTYALTTYGVTTLAFGSTEAHTVIDDARVAALAALGTPTHVSP